MLVTLLSFGLGTLLCFTQSVASTLCKVDEKSICKGGRFGSLRHLDDIKECEILEGNLIIAFRLTNSEEEWQNFGGLKVREIAGYVVFYFVDHLTSLHFILPELRVIRGNTLFKNYSLVIYGLVNLKYIGLTKLSAILRGSVTIKNNPVLSYYAHTVDWNRVTLWNNEGRVTHANFIQPVDNPVVLCSENCSFGENKEDRLCWSEDACQTVCHNETLFSLSCSESGKQCPEDCVGGCYEEGGKTYCYACKHFKYSNRCTKDCFPTSYEVEKYRCVSREDCTERGWKMIERNGKKLCVEKCPRNYEERKGGGSICFPCKEGKCKTVCSGGIIESVGDAQRLEGCTKVNESLEIRIFSSRLTNELTTYLSQIQEVEGYVHVYESTEIQSLQFLANLSVIHGKKLWHNYSLIVHDNDELQDLWNASPHLDLKKGKVMFYANPKLCSQNIERLVGEKMWKTSVENKEIRRILNGNKKACDINFKFKFYPTPTPFEGTLNVSIDPTQLLKDFWKRKLVGFFVFYQETKDENLDYYGESEWKRHFKEYNAQMNNQFYVLLEDLKPVTKYAIYLETQTTDFLQNFRSKIKYVSTLPFNPSDPEEPSLVKAGRGFIEISWEKPRFPNGEIDHYIVSVTPTTLERDWSISDLCDENARRRLLKNIDENNNLKEEEKGLSSLDDKNATPKSTYPCPNQNESPLVDETQVAKVRLNRREHFDLGDDLSALINEPVLTTAKRQKRDLKDTALLEKHCGKPSSTPRKTRSRRSVKFEELTRGHETTLQEKPWSHSLPRKLENCNVNLKKSRETRFCRYEPSQNEMIVYEYEQRPLRILNLTSNRYEIKIKACHKPNVSNEVCEKEGCVKLCSFRYALKHAHVTREVWTPEEDLKVRNIKILKTAENMVNIEWSHPLFKSGEEQLAYEIITRHLKTSSDNTDSSKRSFCRDSSVNQTWLEGLIPGNHSVEIVALSRISGELLHSQKAYFLIPNSVGGGKRSKDYLIVFTFILILFICGIFVYIKISKENREKMFAKMETTANSQFGSPKQEEEEDGDIVPPWKEFLESEIEAQFIHSRENLSIMSYMMGKGEFGEVTRGTLRVSNCRIIQVAAKRPKSTSANFSQQLIKEAKLMLEIKSYHLVRSYGVVSSDTELFLIMELMHHGSLREYLREKKKSENILDLFVIEQVMKFAVQIADGMAYLSSKKIFHMDLAARNCLLDGNLNVKVSDFGMSRLIDGEYYSFCSKEKAVPCRWMPPEYFIDTRFTAKSDVWSYGIVLWEIVNYGKTPYPTLATSDIVKEKVSNGQTLSPSIPSWVSSHLASLMAKCWHFCQNDRPDFKGIVNYLLKYTDGNFKMEFRNKSFYYCGEINHNDDFTACGFSSDENPASVSLDVEEDSSPNTPLTSPSSPAVVPGVSRTNSLQGQRKAKIMRERILLTRWRHHLSSVRDSLSSSCPFICSDRSCLSDNQKYACADVSVNNLGTEFSKLSPRCKADNSCKVSPPAEEKINDEESFSNVKYDKTVSFYSPMRFKLNNCNLTSTKNTKFV